MLSSSRMTRPKVGSAINSSDFAQARSAAATSRLRSWVSQVKPSPMVCHDTWSPKIARASRAGVCQAPLMNCTTPPRWPRPSMRNARPKAAVDFPLPGPVWTMSSPFSMVFSATSASWTALRLAILARWRSVSASSTILDIGLPLGFLHDKRQSRDHQNNKFGTRREPLIEPTLQVAEAPRQFVVGHDAETDLVRYQNDRAGTTVERRFEAIDLGIHVGPHGILRQHAVAEPHREAIDQDRGPGCDRRKRARKVVRHLDGLPRAFPPRPMDGDTFRHLGVARLRGRHIDPGRR